MGKVYRAEDKKIKEEVALKLIKPEIASDKKTIERFSNELKMARKISHRNVCRMYDLGEEKGTHYITMEYVPGEDLKRLVRKVGQFSAGKAISIAKQVCEGLAEAHRLGVVHRDLKPQNIMVDEEGNARIMDFGIARSVKGKGITGAGVMIGTPEYMSPEQAEVKDVDQRSDIYSLGVILYEMVTGRVPFEGETPLGIAMKHKSEMPKEPRELNTHIPEDLSRVIMRCLEKDKEKRYQSAETVLSELVKIEKGIPTTERIIPKRKPLTSREITVKFNLRKVFIPSLIFIFLVIAGFILWRVIPSRKAAPVPAPSGKPSLAILYFKNSTGDKSFDVWRDGLSRMLISDLSQSKYIRVVTDDQIYTILTKLNALEKDNFTTEDLKEIANRGGATHLLRGIITKSGNSFRIQATLQETKNLAEIAGNYSADGIGEGSFFGMIDELTRKIKTGLNISESQIADDVNLPVGEITTSSPEAYKLCNEGYRLNYKGEFRKAIEYLEQAVAIDPKFAMAYSLLGSVYDNLGYRSKSIENSQKAFELSDRLPERERLNIQSMHYQRREKTFDNAIAAFGQRLRLDPNDLNAARNFGFIYGNLEQWDKALELYETNIKKRVEVIFPYRNAAAAFRAKGLYDRAQAVLEEYINGIGDIAIIRRGLAVNYLCLGKYDLALVELDRAFSLAPGDYQNIVTKGNILYLKGNFSDAEKEYQKLFSSIEKVAHLSGRNKWRRNLFPKLRPQPTQSRSWWKAGSIRNLCGIIII
jgi:serine/threonine protein kinase